MSAEWTIKEHKEIKKKQIPLLEKAGLLHDYQEIIKLLRENPYTKERNHEKLSPKNRELYSMRINSKHRVVYTIDKENKVVKIYAAWSHYEEKMPK